MTAKIIGKKRKPNYFDKKCLWCNTPMIGIIRLIPENQSDKDAARLICYSCAKKGGL